MKIQAGTRFVFLDPAYRINIRARFHSPFSKVSPKQMHALSCEIHVTINREELLQKEWYTKSLLPMFRSRLSPHLRSELTGQMPQGKQSCSFTCSITKTRKPKTFHPTSSGTKLCNPLTFCSAKQTLGYTTTSPHTAALFFQETQESHLVFSWSRSQLLCFLCWGKIRQERFPQALLLQVRWTEPSWT